MTSSVLRLVRLAVFATCATFPAFAATDATDRAAELLARQGSVALTAAGRHVEIGTYRVQVSAKLGRPDLTLADGTWLYHGRRIEGSSAQGTLIVRFEGGRVSRLELATPAVVAALRLQPKAGGTELVATK
jgi:hypothetical protein